MVPRKYILLNKNQFSVRSASVSALGNWDAYGLCIQHNGHFLSADALGALYTGIILERKALLDAGWVGRQIFKTVFSSSMRKWTTPSTELFGIVYILYLCADRMLNTFIW